MCAWHTCLTERRTVLCAPVSVYALTAIYCFISCERLLGRRLINLLIKYARFSPRTLSPILSSTGPELTVQLNALNKWDLFSWRQSASEKTQIRAGRRASRTSSSQRNYLLAVTATRESELIAFELRKTPFLWQKSHFKERDGFLLELWLFDAVFSIPTNSSSGILVWCWRYLWYFWLIQNFVVITKFS